MNDETKEIRQRKLGRKKSDKRRNGVMRRLMACVLCFMMLIGVLPNTVYASDDTLLKEPVGVRLTDEAGQAIATGDTVRLG